MYMYVYTFVCTRTFIIYVYVLFCVDLAAYFLAFVLPSGKWDNPQLMSSTRPTDSATWWPMAMERGNRITMGFETFCLYFGTLVPAPVFWQLHSRLKALLASQSLSQTSVKSPMQVVRSLLIFLMVFFTVINLMLQRILISVLPCLATGVFTNFFWGGDSVFSWQVASWRRPFMPRRRTAFGDLRQTVNQQNWSKTNHQPSSTIINHHQAQNGVMACFLVNSRVSPIKWWVEMVELQVSDWIYSSQGQRFAAYSPMAGQGRWQHWQAGIGWWMAGAWLVVVSSPFLNLGILQATRVIFFLYAQPTRSKEVLSVEMCRDFESKIDGLERKQVDRTRAW